MIKTILVDDEDIIREGISRFVDWNALGLELIGQSANGQEAAKLIEIAAPEIIITDIKMPRMDGLELLALAKEKQPDCVVIIISSYDEFEYAQQALNLGAFAFLLKPIDTDRLLELLGEAAERIRFLHSGRQRLEAAQADALDSKLKILAFGEAADTFNESEREYLQTFSAFSAVTVYTGEPFFKEGSFYEVLEAQLQKWTAAQKEAVEIKRFLNRQKMTVYCLFHKSSKALAWYDLHHIYMNYYRECVLGISPQVQTADQLAKACRQALEAVEYRFFTADHLIFYDTICRKPEEPFKDAPDWCGRLKFVLQTEETIDSFAGEFLRYILEERISMVMIHTETAAILMELLRQLREAGGKAEDIFFSVPDTVSFVLDEKDPVKMVNRLQEVLKKTAGYMKKLEECQSNSAIYKAKRYLETHYQDQGLRLEDVANYVYINPSYFSTLFSKEMNISFGSYLTQLRMEKAKQLLKTTQLKIYEIAEQTDYQNVSWFTVAFKKYTGKSPGEYRKGM